MSTCLKIVAIGLLLSSAYSVSIGCPNMINLAYGLGMQSAQPTVWASLQEDCCSIASVTCIGQRVTQINWNNRLLTGVLNGSAIPMGVTSFQAANNQVTGNISSVLPSGLLRLWMHNNRLTGFIPPTLPSELLLLDLHLNQLTGNLPLTLPSRLAWLYLDTNKLSGDMPNLPATLLNLEIYGGNRFSGTINLNRPNEVVINDNWITDLIISDSSLLNSCDLTNTPLLGNPRIVGLTICTKNGLYSPNLLPNTKITAAFTLGVPTGTPLLSTSSATTSIHLESITWHFKPHLAFFNFSLISMVRFFINTLGLGIILSKTPFRRQFKALFNSKEKEEKQTSSIGDLDLLEENKYIY